MPRFEYITQASKGAPLVRSFAEATTLAELNARLVHLNKPVLKVFDTSARTQKKKATIRLPLRSKLLLMQQLEACTHLGMDLHTALGICVGTMNARSKTSKTSTALISELRDKVSRGTSFTRAVASYEEIFDEVSQGLIAAGEEGGTFGESLTNVRKIWARNEDLQNRTLMMMIYPAIVLIVAIGVVWLLMTKVVPQFIHVLSEMKVDLPLPTRLLVFFSNSASQHPLLLFIGGIGLVVLFLQLPKLIRATPSLHRLSLKIPIIGHLLLLLIRANFCRTFSQLKRARSKTTVALVLCRDLSWNYEYRSAIARTLVRVQRGESLSGALNDDLDIFGEMIVNGLSFMEASGADTVGLFRLTELLERELDSYITVIRQILDPLLILILGIVIGGIVFATFLPAIEILQKV
jgi:type II secretory pathway component PulF